VDREIRLAIFRFRRDVFAWIAVRLVTEKDSRFALKRLRRSPESGVFGKSRPRGHGKLTSVRQDARSKSLGDNHVGSKNCKKRLKTTDNGSDSGECESVTDLKGEPTDLLETGWFPGESTDGNSREKRKFGTLFLWRFPLNLRY
jgi:hypothetical protein